ncbi:MAG: nuclear transport factor 2 family protein [Janthinobacterium lividum]
MTRFDYREYIEAFNRGDDRALIERYFVPEFRFIGTTRAYSSREEFLHFLDWAHDGVREIIRPITVLQQEDKIFAEIDMDFIATKPRDDFPFVRLAPGDLITVKFFVLYTLRDGMVTELKSMTWPADYEVTKAPLLGGHPGQRAAFLAYTTAFSAGDGARFGRFYTEDVVLELPNAPPIVGRQAIVDNYARMFTLVRETLVVNHLVVDDGGIAADVVSTFSAHEDAPDFSVMPLHKGQAVSVRVFVYYTLQDGRISHIKVARAGSPTLS